MMFGNRSMGETPAAFAWVLQEKVPRRGTRDRPYRAYSESGKLPLQCRGRRVSDAER